MATVGRAIRQAMRDEARERAHPEYAAARIRRREIEAQVVREREAMFPVLTAENFGEALRWQAARLLELEAQG